MSLRRELPEFNTFTRRLEVPVHRTFDSDYTTVLDIKALNILTLVSDASVTMDEAREAVERGMQIARDKERRHDYRPSDRLRLGTQIGALAIAIAEMPNHRVGIDEAIAIAAAQYLPDTYEGHSLRVAS